MEEVKKDRRDPGQESGKKKRDAKRILIDGGTDLTLRILALIIAVTVWFVLSITQYPTINKTITGVHVDFSLNGTVAEERGLEALDYKEITVDVEIKGMNYEIGNYSDNDLSATVNLDDVTKQGTYLLEIDVKSTHPTDRVTIVSVTPDTIEVDFDRITSKTLPLTTEAPLINAEEGFTLRQTLIQPSEVTVSGPETVLENISRAAVKINGSQKLSENETMTSDVLVFYDADDNQLDTSKLTTSETQFSVSFEVYKKKTLELSMDVTGLPEGFDKSSLPLVYSNETVSVITPDLDDSDTETLVVGSVALSDVSLYSSFNFPVNTPAGEIDLDGVDSVTVNLDSEGYTSKTFEITSDRMKLKNIPTGYKSTVGTSKLASVTFYGPEEELETIESEDVYAIIDLSDISAEGSYTREALIYAEGCKSSWCYGKKTVQVNVTLPTSSTASSSESE